MDLEMAYKQREELKLEWIKSGCKETFYEWLLNRIEAVVRK
jgi:hypothetical protein